MNTFSVCFAVATNKDGVAQVGKCYTLEDSAVEECLLDEEEEAEEQTIR